jgi:cytochrome c553
VAGQPAEFTVAQLKLYQARKRYNVAMFPYTEPRELTEQDMKDVAAYLARIDLPARAPVFKDTDGALDRLLAMEKVLVVPRVQGDGQKGQALFRQKCATCHGRNGRGRKNAPSLVGQYPAYLRRQVDGFLAGNRPHDHKEAGKGSLHKLAPGDFTDILAWLTDIQEQPTEEAAPDAAVTPAP